MFFVSAANFIKDYTFNLSSTTVTSLQVMEQAESASNCLILVVSVFACALFYALFLRPRTSHVDIDSPSRSGSHGRHRNVENSNMKIRGKVNSTYIYENDNYPKVNCRKKSNDRSEEFDTNSAAFVEDTPRNELTSQSFAKPFDSTRVINKRQPSSLADVTERGSFRVSPVVEVATRMEHTRNSKLQLIPSTPRT